MNEKYKQLVQKIKNIFARNGLERHVRRATHDWLIVLSGATVLTLVFCAVGAYVFFFFRAPPSGDEVITPSQVTFDKDTLENIVDTYDARTQQYTVLKETLPEVPQPGTSASESQETVPTEEETEAPTLEEQMQNEETPFVQ